MRLRGCDAKTVQSQNRAASLFRDQRQSGFRHRPDSKVRRRSLFDLLREPVRNTQLLAAGVYWHNVLYMRQVWRRLSVIGPVNLTGRLNCYLVILYMLGYTINVNKCRQWKQEVGLENSLNRGQDLYNRTHPILILSHPNMTTLLHWKPCFKPLNILFSKWTQ